MCERETEFYALLCRTPDIHPYAFENNWPYILQATRNGLYIHRKGNSIVYYTKRFPQRPHTTTVIVHALGSRRKSLLVEVARRECESGRAVIIKNVPMNELAWWQTQGFRVRARAWDRYSRHDDNSFPQYVSHASVIRDRAYSRKYRKVLRRFDVRRQIVTSPYEERFDAAARAMLEEYAQHLHRKKAGSYTEVVRAHLFFFDRSIDICIRLQHVEHGELIGWSFFTPVGEIAYSNAIAGKVETDLMKYLVHRSMTWITQHHPEVTFFGRQGSENAGQSWMKSRLKPIEEIHKVHMTMV
jgi:hypothetical protein